MDKYPYWEVETGKQGTCTLYRSKPALQDICQQPKAKPIRLAERAGLSPRSYCVVGQAELRMSHWLRAAANLQSNFT